MEHSDDLLNRGAKHQRQAQQARSPEIKKNTVLSRETEQGKLVPAGFAADKLAATLTAPCFTTVRCVLSSFSSIWIGPAASWQPPRFALRAPQLPESWLKTSTLVPRIAYH